MANTTQTLVHMFTMYPIRTRVMHELGATSLSAFLHAFGLALHGGESERYLNPLRDMPEMSGWIRDMLKENCEVRFIGQDLHALEARINHPETLARRWAAGSKLTIWIAVVSAKECQSLRRGRTHQGVGVTRFVHQGTMPTHVKDKVGSWGGDWWRAESVNENAIEVLFVDRTERSAIEVGISIPNTWEHFENMFQSVRKIVRIADDGSAKQSMVMPIMNVKHDTGTIVELHGKYETGVSTARHIRQLRLSWYDNIFVRVQRPAADRPFEIPYAESGFELFVIPLWKRGRELAEKHNVDLILPSLARLFQV